MELDQAKKSQLNQNDARNGEAERSASKVRKMDGVSRFGKINASKR
jgi:hypothetical protein